MRWIASLLVGFVTLTPIGGWADDAGLRRLTDREDLLGWEAVGRLDLAERGFCTATLIAPDLILTAAHCAYDRQTGALYPDGSLTFRAGLRDGVSIADRQVARIAVHPGFRAQDRSSAERIRLDVALMRLDAPITVAQADPFVLHSGDLTGAEVSVSSYGQGRAEAMSRQRSCRLLNAEQGLMAFDCNVTFGSSGSAVFAQVGTRGRILSVVSSMARMNGQQVALGMELPALVADLKRRMRAEDHAPVAPRVVIRNSTSARPQIGAKFVRPGGS